MNLLCFFVVFACFCVSGSKSEPSPCTTPNGEKALCVRTRSCSVFKEAFFSEDPSVQKFVDESTSSCEGGGSMICCGNSAHYTHDSNKEVKTDPPPPPPPPSKKEYALQKLLPTQRHCGMQHTDDYFYNETRTAVDEFPWLLGVYYDDYRKKRSPEPKPINSALLRSLAGGYNPKVTYKCTGVLISTRYALTSSSCYSYASMQVSLGQYDEKKRVTCVKTAFGEQDCTDPTVNVTVEEKIQSPNNSLLLLRLEKRVQYTDFIRPICLPMNETIRPQVDDTIFTSGWGYEATGDNVTVVKKRIKQNITSSENCREDSSSERLCTTLETDTNYVCKSDRGGPLMYRYKKRNWYVEGIIDVNRCVNDTVQGVRITPALVDWILENMKD